MPLNRELTRLWDHSQDPFDEPENKEDIRVTLGDFSARTRSQATAVKRFAKEAGLKVPEEGIAPRAAISSRIFKPKPNLWDLDIEAEEDESFPSVPAQKNPWPNISRESSLQAWQIWDEQQGRRQGVWIVSIDLPSQ